MNYTSEGKERKKNGHRISRRNFNKKDHEPLLRRVITTLFELFIFLAIF